MFFRFLAIILMLPTISLAKGVDACNAFSSQNGASCEDKINNFEVVEQVNYGSAQNIRRHTQIPNGFNGEKAPCDAKNGCGPVFERNGGCSGNNCGPIFKRNEGCTKCKAEEVVEERTYVKNYIPATNVNYDYIHRGCEDFLPVNFKHVDFRLKKQSRFANYMSKLGNYRFRIFGCRRENQEILLNVGRTMQKDMNFFEVFNQEYGQCIPQMKMPKDLCDANSQAPLPEYVLTAEIVDYAMNVCDEFDWQKVKNKEERTGSSEMTVVWRLTDVAQQNVVWKGESVGYADLDDGLINGEIYLVEESFRDALKQLRYLEGFEKQISTAHNEEEQKSYRKVLADLEKLINPAKCAYVEEIILAETQPEKVCPDCNCPVVGACPAVADCPLAGACPVAKVVVDSRPEIVCPVLPVVMESFAFNEDASSHSSGSFNVARVFNEKEFPFDSTFVEERSYLYSGGSSSDAERRKRAIKRQKMIEAKINGLDLGEDLVEERSYLYSDGSFSEAEIRKMAIKRQKMIEAKINGLDLGEDLVEERSYLYSAGSSTEAAKRQKELKDQIDNSEMFEDVLIAEVLEVNVSDIEDVINNDSVAFAETGFLYSSGFVNVNEPKLKLYPFDTRFVDENAYLYSGGNFMTNEVCYVVENEVAENEVVAEVLDVNVPDDEVLFGSRNTLSSGSNMVAEVLEVNVPEVKPESVIVAEVLEVNVPEGERKPLDMEFVEEGNIFAEGKKDSCKGDCGPIFKRNEGCDSLICKLNERDEKGGCKSGDCGPIFKRNEGCDSLSCKAKIEEDASMNDVSVETEDTTVIAENSGMEELFAEVEAMSRDVESAGMDSYGNVDNVRIVESDWIEIPVAKEKEKIVETAYVESKGMFCVENELAHRDMDPYNLYKTRASIVEISSLSGSKRGVGLIINDQFILTSADLIGKDDNNFKAKTINGYEFGATGFRFSPNKNVALLLADEKIDYTPLPLELNLPPVGASGFMTIGMGLQEEGNAEGYVDDETVVKGYRFSEDKGAEIITDKYSQSLTVGGALVDDKGNIYGLAHYGKKANENDPDMYMPIEVALKSLSVELCGRKFLDKEPWVKSKVETKVFKAPEEMNKKEIK